MQKFGLPGVIFFLFLMLLFQLPSNGQNKKFFVITGRIVPEVEIAESGTIDINKGNGVTKVDIPKNGRFRLELEYFNEYTLTFMLAGHFSKTIIVSTDIPQDVWKRDNDFPPFPMIVQLLREIEGIDKSFTLKPSGRVFYGTKTDNFESESIFNEIQIAEQIETAITQSGQVKKEAQTISKQEALDLAAKQKNYDLSINEADALFKRGEHQLALLKYQNAQKLFPEKAYANDRIAEIQNLIKALEITAKQKAELEQKYTIAIARANGFFDQKTYKEARPGYEEALQYKPDDVFASGRILEINRLLALLEKQKQFDDLIAQADKSYQSKLFDQAISLYNQAKQLIPGNEYPQNQINLINQGKQELAKLELLEKEFNQTIQSGDKLARQKDYIQAIDMYRKALVMKPGNKLATDKIGEFEMEMVIIETDKKYQETIALADKSFTSENYADARKIYTQALAIKPNEAHPTTRITKIDEILAEKARLQQIENEFLAMVGKGDVAFGQKEYEAAKTSYTNALGIKPNSAEVKEKIKNIDSILQKLAEEKKKEEERLLALAAKEKAYADAIALADKSFSSENYPDARKIYTEALAIKPNEAHPTTRITKIDEILAEKAKLQQTENEFLAMVGKGDVAFGQKEYEAAKVSYTSALGIKPNSAEVKEKIKNIDSILQKLAEEKKKEEERLLALAAKEKAYADAIALADKSFSSENYPDARKIYTEALAIKPNEAHPTTRITKIDEILAEKARLQQIENEFLAMVGKGDVAFGQKEYDAAKASYTNALGIKPNSAEVKEKIKNIDSILQKIAEEKKKEEERLLALAAKEKAYADAIALADKSFTSENYADARKIYTEALAIKPNEAHPTTRITKIDEILAEKARLQQTENEFLAMVGKGDVAFGQKEYDAAKASYTSALGIKPNSAEVKEKIKNIESILQKIADDKKKEEERLLALAAKEKAYADAIALADKSFSSENYPDARKIYTEALAIKPNEAHPTTRITKIDEILAEKARLQQIENEFLAMVGKGDVAFGQKEYEAAKVSYTNALGIKPNSAEVKEKIKNIDSILQKIAEEKKKEEERLLALAAKEKAYADAIALADKSFSSENYPDARKIYTEALAIKPNEAHPTTRITKIDEILAEKARLQQIENEFLAMVGKGDVAFGQKEYDAAKTSYTSALVIKPNSAEVKEKIKNIDSILQKIADDKKKEEERLLALAAKEKAYADAIALADKSFTSENYPDARKIYTEALAIKPNEAHPTTRITKIDEILAEKARLQQIENEFLAMVGKGDVAFGQKEYEAAKASYTSALGIKPNSAEVKEKIKNIDSILQKIADDKKKEEERLLALAAKEKAYADAIALADKSFTSENYPDARKIYTEALAIKPNEAHPTTRITKIDEILAEKARLQQIENEFLAMVGKGDVALGQKEFEAAKTSYTNALGIKPNSAEVKEKIKNIESILQKIADDKKKEEERLLALAAKEKAYADAIALADKSFTSENYPDARKIYTEALAIKPNEAHPTTRITKIDEILAEKARLQQIENEFLAMVGKGDVAFGQKEYEAAKVSYTSALGIKPNSAEVKEKIKNIESILQKIADDKKKEEERLLALAAKEKAYADAIALADKSFSSENYPDARKIYTEALAIKPNEAHPTIRITKIDEILAEKAKLQQTENEFLALVGKGDVAFGQKEYEAAKTSYTSALGIKPNSVEVKEKIKNIDSILQKLADDKKKEEERLLALAAKEKAYADAIAMADKSFSSENYADARKIYTEALAIKPNDMYPTGQIGKIDEILAEKAKLQQTENEFLALVGKGDVAFGQKEYEAAKTSYTNALGIKPNSVEVKEKIKNIDSILQKLADDKKKEEERLLALAAKEKAYADAIAMADKSFTSENYLDARKIYTEALAIKPNDMYPTGQIGKIDEILAEKAKLQQTENEFLALVGKGDVAFGQKEYEAAKTNYTNALGIKPNSVEVKEKIKNIESILQKLADDKKKEEERLLALAAKEKAYADAIALADKSFDKKDYVVAQSDYRKALTFKADETYPATRIKEIDEIIAKEQQASLLDENYKSIILRADKSFGSENYADARKIYTEALVIKPNDMYPTGQIGKIDEIMAEKAKSQQTENEFLALVGKGDVAFGQKEYEAAKTSYTNALGIKPNSAEVKEKIKNIESILQKIADDKKKEEERLLALAAKEKAYADAIALADKSFDKKDYVVAQSDYRKALTFKADETYPANRIKEIDEIIAKEQQASLLDENYKSIILRADKSFGSENYTDARKIYTEALAIKPNDMYPTGQIGKIDEILAEKAKLQQTENEFLALVGKGDVAFGQKEYEAAKTSYTSALGIKPNSAEVKDKIKNIESILQKIADDKKKEEERLLALAAKEKAYADAIALADKSFDKKDYVVAQSDYRKALTFKADETYPANRIKEIDEIIAKEQQASLLDENYKSIILRADKSFGSENYADARKIYTEALAIKPNDMYPTGQIGKIDEILAEKARLQQIENEFLAMVGKGDVAFGQKEYEAAKVSYTSALGIKPNSVEVKEKIKNIESILQKIADDKKKEEERLLALAAKEKAYADAIALADKSFDKKDYVVAQSDYRKALTFKADETYPANRIKEIDEIIAKEQQASLLDENYKSIILRADKSFGSENYADARKIYTEALAIKPNDMYPTGQIGKIDEILAEKAKLQQTENEFLALVGKGDVAFGQKEYEAAKTSYTSALGIKPNSAEVKDKIKNIDSILQKLADDKKKEEERLLALAAKEKAYADAIALADKSFDKKDYVVAQSDYRKALTFKADETYPANRIKEIDEIIAKEQQASLLDENYKSIILRADKSFGSENYADARKIYTEALAIKPNDMYPTGQIGKIDEILAEKAKLQQTENEFLALVGKGDVAFGQKEYEAAKTSYTNALGIKPNSAEVKDKIKNIDSILQKLADDKKKEEERLLALAAKEKAYADAIALADKSFDKKDYVVAQSDYRKALTFKADETYPANRIKEIDEIFAKEQQASLLDENYKSIILRADKSFGSENYADARKIYTEALAIKPNDMYPTGQIGKIDEIMAEKAKSQQTENDFLAMVEKGDVAFGQKEYEAAKTNYTNALGIKPNSAEVKEKIKNIESILQQIAVKEGELAEARLKEGASQGTITEAQERSFNEAMTKADNAFIQNDFNTAKTGYETALTIKANDPNAKEKLGQTEAKLAQLAKLTLAYNTAINAANKFVSDKSYKEAKEKYQESLQYLPDSEYPKRQIEKLDELIAQADLERQKDELYASEVKEGESLFTSKEYSGARLSFVKASELKPAEQLPVSRIKEIDKILSDMALAEAKNETTESAYQQSIRLGDIAFKADQLNEATTQYEIALDNEANDQYAKQQLAEITKRRAALEDQIRIKEIQDKQNKEAQAQREIDEKYRLALSAADNAFKVKNYAVARLRYQEAQIIKPAESYPNNQIALIDKLMKEAKPVETYVPEEPIAKQTVEPVNKPVSSQVESVQSTEARAQSFKPVADYSESIQKADDSFRVKDYTVARFFYYKASELKPDEEYPKTQIEMIRKLVDSELSALDRSGYEKAITQADEAFSKESYSIAKFYYYKALEIKSWEKYPKDRIQEILALTHSLLSEKEEKEYRDIIAKADEAYFGKDISIARFYFNKAIAIKTDENYPRIKLKDIQKLIDQDVQDQKNMEYNTLIDLADQALQAENYSIARFNYNKALSRKPDEKYPKDQLKRIKEALDNKNKQ